MSDKPQAELHPAFVWDCEKCGEENFCRSIVKEISAEEQAEIAEHYGLDDDGPLRIMTAAHPEFVTCEHCEAEYEARNSWAEDDPREH